MNVIKNRKMKQANQKFVEAMRMWFWVFMFLCTSMSMKNMDTWYFAHES